MIKEPSPDIRAILAAIPLNERESLTAARILSLTHQDNQLRLTLNVESLTAAERQVLKKNIAAALKAHDISAPAHIIMTADKPAAANPANSAPSLRPASIKHIVAVASGKGGVGKSTLAVALAAAFSQLRYRVGIMDADIHGPSLPTMLGVAETMPPQNEEGLIIPPTPHGIAMMSVGLLLEKNTPLIWRGPMVISAMTTLLTKVAWGELDILIIDLPPGTGDATLTLAQKAQPDGIVVISTPQEVALMDARKAILAFSRLAIPILGIVENMSLFQCPHCGETSTIFSEGGGEKEAAAHHIPLLANLPLNPALCTASEQGTPLNLTQPDDAHAATMRALAEQLQQILNSAKDAPISRKTQ